MTCVGDAVRLSRRDRAAMTLALCELRGSSLSSAIGALQHTDGGAVPYLSPILTNAQAVMDDAIQSAPLSPGWYRAHYRNSDLIRAPPRPAPPRHPASRRGLRAVRGMALRRVPVDAADAQRRLGAMVLRVRRLRRTWRRVAGAAAVGSLVGQRADEGAMTYTRPAVTDGATLWRMAVLGEAYTLCRKRLSWVELSVLKARSAGDRVAARRLSREARERNRTLRSLYDAREMLRGGWA
jgi:hypothetical protein